jgi:hypothetical protein
MYSHIFLPFGIPLLVSLTGFCFFAHDQLRYSSANQREKDTVQVLWIMYTRSRDGACVESFTLMKRVPRSFDASIAIAPIQWWCLLEVWRRNVCTVPLV